VARSGSKHMPLALKECVEGQGSTTATASARTSTAVVSVVEYEACDYCAFFSSGRRQLHWRSDRVGLCFRSTQDRNRMLIPSTAKASASAYTQSCVACGSITRWSNATIVVVVS
jgi:hypothetical protein